MNKWFFVSILLLLALPTALSATVYERSFNDMGYEAFQVEGAQKRGCQEVSFLYPELDYAGGKLYRIASIGLEIGPVFEGKLDVNVSLNGESVAELGLSDFKCSSGKCWERLFLPEEKALMGENFLEICLGTGKAITSVMLSDESKIGLYTAADFSDESAFQVYAEDTELVMGEKTTMHILLHNQGSDSTYAEIQYARPVAEDKNAYSVVEGDNYFSGTVEAGQTVEITYVIKPRRPVPMTLPPAIVYYDNEFGETEQKFSNLVQIEAREPEKALEAFIVKERESYSVGEPANFQVSVKNVGIEAVYELDIEAFAGGLGITKKGGSVQPLLPKETKTQGFTATSLEPGEFEIGCEIAYSFDQNLETEQCIPATIRFTEPETNPIIYIAVVFVAIAVVAYVYIMKG